MVHKNLERSEASGCFTNAVLLGRACPKPYFIISIMTDQRLIYSNCQSLQVH